jgi:molybdopterin converting factor small subunit
MITGIPYHQKTQADRIVQYLSRFADKPVTAKQISSHLKKLTNDSVIVTTKKDAIVPEHTIKVDAFYDINEGESDNIPYEILISYSDTNHQIVMPLSEWKKFASTVINLLETEMIQSAQYRISNKSKKKINQPLNSAQKYLNNPGEVEAYAYMFAKDLLYKAKNYDNALRILKYFSSNALSQSQAKRLLSSQIYSYLKVFNFDHKNETVQTLIKRTYQLVQQFKKQNERDIRVNERNQQIIVDAEKALKKKKELEKEGENYYTIVSKV